MNFVAIDFETANHNRSSACAIGIAVVENDEIVETRHFFIHPTPNYYAIINKHIHGISEKDTDNALSFLELWNSELKRYLVDRDLVAHNAPFEKSVLNALSEEYNIQLPTNRLYCSLTISKHYLDLVNYKLDNVCSEFGINFCNHHNAMADAIGCAEIIIKIAQANQAQNFEDLYIPILKAEHIEHFNDSIFSPRNQVQNYIANQATVKGKTFCFTGTLSFIQRDIARQVIENAGGIFKNSISSKVNYLVVGDLSIFGDGFESTKMKKVREYKDKGCAIEVITEEQFQEMVIYEGPKITKEAIDYDSNSLLNRNVANALYGKGVCLSEGFNSDFMMTLSLLGVQLGPTHYDNESVLTDYFIISNSVLSDLFTNKIKSPSIIRMESAMKSQLDIDSLDSNTNYHRIKCISEDAIREFIRRRKQFEKEVADGIEPKSMILL